MSKPYSRSNLKCKESQVCQSTPLIAHSTNACHVQRPAPPSDDDSVWEDVTETQQSFHLSTSPSPAGSIRSSPRKRKPVHRTTYIAAPPRRPPSVPLPPRQQKPPRNVIAREDVVDGALQGASFTLRYLVVSLWLLALIVGRISQTLQGAFAPLCYLPGLYGSRFCRPPDSHGKEKAPLWADYPKLVNVQSTTFENLLDESAGGSGLSLEVKKAEMATTDLATLVRVSDLKSRDLVADTLAQFVTDAKTTGRGLQKFSSKLNGAVDSIMAVNDYALHAIEAAHSDTPSRSFLHILIPWSPPRPTNDIVTQTFTEAMSVLSTAMERLILEAEVNLANLDNLEERLSTLHEMATREDKSLSSAKAEVLAELWTKLGGNRRTLRNFNNNLQLLKNLGLYRKKALVHVTTALQTLRAMSSDMEDIRERVAAPELTGPRIPVEVHMKSIRNGLERLREGRDKAKKLEEDAMRRVLAIGPDSES